MSESEISLLYLQHGRVSCVYMSYKFNVNMLGKEKRDEQFFPPHSPSLRFSLCMIHNGAEHLTGVSAAPLRSFPGRVEPRDEAPHPPTRRTTKSSTSLHSRFTRTRQDTHLHSPGNSVKLRTATAREKEAGGTGGKGMDRSTGRVVVPFSGCAAPSLHPCWRC